MSQCWWTGIEPETPPWEAGVGRIKVRCFESRYSHYCPRYFTQNAQSHIKWSAGVYSSGIKRAEPKTARSFELRGYSSWCLHFLEGLLICEHREIALSSVEKKIPDIYPLFIVLSSSIIFIRIKERPRTLPRTRTRARDHIVDCSADTVRTVVAGFLIRSF